MGTKQKKFRFVHNKHRFQTYIVGEVYTLMANKKVANVDKICFDEGVFETDNEEHARFLREHPDFNNLVFEERKSDAQEATESTELFQDALQIAKNKQRKKKAAKDTLAAAIA